MTGNKDHQAERATATAEPMWPITEHDSRILRSLAQQVSEIARAEDNLARKERWLAHNALQGAGPMILAEIGGLRRSGQLEPARQLQCQQQWARDVELELRCQIYQYQEVRDDHVVVPFLHVNWRVAASDYGVEVVQHDGSTDGIMGSRVWDAPIKDLQRDFDKLHPRAFSVDRETTLAWKSHLENIVGDILPVRIRGSFWWTMGLTQPAIRLIGLQELMLFMIDDPEGLHRLMAFLRDDHLAFVRWLEDQGLFSLNNEGDYIGSGSRGYTRELPQADWQPGRKVRMRDLWVLSESQETVGVGPEMFSEFIYPYQQPLMERFGLSYYGCCEPLHSRWHIVRQARNLRKVSISPWCDQGFMARELGSRYVFCRKPNPSQVSTEHFDEEAIREDLRTTLRTTHEHGCGNVELVMKDVHTLNHQPWRLGRWVELAREVCAEFR